MRYILFLFFCLIFSTSAFAETANWQKLRSEAQQFRKSDPVYSLFKLRQAWRILAAESTEKAFKELREDIALSYGELNPVAEKVCLAFNQDQFQMHWDNSVNVDQWQTWKIYKKKDALYLTVTAPEIALDERAGCLSGMISAEEAAAKDPQKRKDLDAYYAHENAKLKEKLALLPVVIPSQNEKYQDLLALASPLKDGENKPVSFDLNPFLPRQLSRIDLPLRMPQ